MCVRVCFYRHVLFILNQLYCIQAVMGAPQGALWRPLGPPLLAPMGSCARGAVPLFHLHPYPYTQSMNAYDVKSQHISLKFRFTKVVFETHLKTKQSTTE